MLYRDYLAGVLGAARVSVDQLDIQACTEECERNGGVLEGFAGLRGAATIWLSIGSSCSYVAALECASGQGVWHNRAPAAAYPS